MKKLLKGNRLLFAVTVALSAAVSVAYVYLAMILQQVTDTAVGGDMAAFRRVVILAVAYLLGMGAIGFVNSLLGKLLVCRVVRRLRQSVTEGILRRNAQDFSSVNTADYLSAVTNDIKLVEDNGIMPLLTIVQNAVMFVAAVAVLFSINAVIGLVLIGCLVLMFTVPALFGKALQRRQDTLSKRLSAFTVKVKEILAGYEVVKAYGLDDHVRADCEEHNGAAAAARFHADRLIAANESISQVLAYLTVFSGFFIGAYLILTGSITAGVLLALIQLSSSFVNPLMLVMDGMPKVQGIRPVLARLADITDYEDTGLTGTKTPAFHESIRMENLGFAYNGDQPVLKGVSLELRKGRKYAVVGHSGSGKSTLVRLLTGCYAGYSGGIRYDGQEMRTLDIGQLRGMISVIHQNVYMFNGSIRDNICLHRSFSDKALEHAVSVSGVGMFLDDMSDGLDSSVGENGSCLSGGQRQRVAVARALIQDKPVMILDEGTAAIDMQTAYSIESSLLALEGSTLVTITHNMSPELLSQYDEIIFMRDGAVCETGSYDDLMRRRGAFHGFCCLPEAVKATA